MHFYISKMAAGREGGEGIGDYIKSNMAANRVLLFYRFKTARYLGKNSLDFLCIVRRFYAQNAASAVAQKPTERSQDRGTIFPTECEQIYHVLMYTEISVSLHLYVAFWHLAAPGNEQNKRKFRVSHSSVASPTI